MKYFIFLLIIFNISTFSQEIKNWTIMHYAAGSNSSEADLLSDVEEMKKGKVSSDYNLVLLIDRIEGFSNDTTTLDANFTDTRLYEIEINSFKRLDGKDIFPEISLNQESDLNMGDALNLKKFIQYCKKYYPAKNYLLILRSHGNGLAMCADVEESNRDRLYPAEITNILSKKESVDILGLDVCSMAGLENLYQWRPDNNAFSADYVIASAPLSGAWAYDKILERLTLNNSEAKIDNLDPKAITALELSNLIYEVIYNNQRWASWGLFDNTKITKLKLSIDEASISLAKENKNEIYKIIENTLGYYHNTSNNLEIAQLTFPYLDAFHFWNEIKQNNSFSEETRSKANKVCEALDELVISSYYGQGYLPETDNFKGNSSGVYQIIPQGNKVFSQSNYTFWSHCGWYSPLDKSKLQDAYGQYDWCKDGATEGNNKVENFYELLDYLFDENNDESGGVNAYQW